MEPVLFKYTRCCFGQSYFASVSGRTKVRIGASGTNKHKEPGCEVHFCIAHQKTETNLEEHNKRWESPETTLDTI